MIESFPSDQRDLIRSRLGPILAELEAEYDAMEPKESELPKTNGDRIRGGPRMSYPVTAFYWACLREMGSAGAASGGPPRLPNPTQAWLEVANFRPKSRESIEHGSLIEPGFTHPKVAETVQSFGGWKAMWKEFSELKQGWARNRFIRAYRELTE